MKKILALTLVLVMVLALCACGGSGKNPAVGTWTLTGMKEGGQDYSAYLAMLGMEITLVLNEDGTGYMESMGEKVDVTWDANSITSQGDSISYTLDGDTLTMAQDGTEMIFTRK